MNCPKCSSEYTYEEDGKFICTQCFNEFSIEEKNEEKKYYDCYGTELRNGDSVILIKGLKVKGSNKDLKVGQKVKNIRLVDADHDIECKIDGFGQMLLKTEFVKKV